MGLLLFFSIGFGFVLIALIGAFSPKVVPARSPSASRSQLLELDAEELGKVVAVLLAKMGLELERASGGGSQILELWALNPAPIVGGSILVHCIPEPEQGNIDGRAVQGFIRAVRSAYVSKGLLFTTGLLTPDARLEAEGAPVELFDRDQLQRLIDEHLEDGLKLTDLDSLPVKLSQPQPDREAE